MLRMSSKIFLLIYQFTINLKFVVHILDSILRNKNFESTKGKFMYCALEDYKKINKAEGLNES